MENAPASKRNRRKRLWSENGAILTVATEIGPGSVTVHHSVAAIAGMKTGVNPEQKYRKEKKRQVLVYIVADD